MATSSKGYFGGLCYFWSYFFLRAKPCLPAGRASPARKNKTRNNKGHRSSLCYWWPFTLPGEDIRPCGSPSPAVSSRRRRGECRPEDELHTSRPHREPRTVRGFLAALSQSPRLQARYRRLSEHISTSLPRYFLQFSKVPMAPGERETDLKYTPEQQYCQGVKRALFLGSKKVV